MFGPAPFFFLLSPLLFLRTLSIELEKDTEGEKASKLEKDYSVCRDSSLPFPLACRQNDCLRPQPTHHPLPIRFITSFLFSGHSSQYMAKTAESREGPSFLPFNPGKVETSNPLPLLLEGRIR